MINSSTYAVQEIDIIDRILDQAGYSENLENVILQLTQFEGKHFRQYTPQQTPQKLLKRINEVLIKFTNNSVINSFHTTIDNKTPLETKISINIRNKIGILRKYKSDLDLHVSKLISGKSKLTNKESVQPENYHPKFSDKVPRNKRPIARILEQSGIRVQVSNFEIYRCIFPESELYDYKRTQKQNNRIISYRFRTLNRYLKPLGLIAKRRFNYSVLDIYKK